MSFDEITKIEREAIEKEIELFRIQNGYKPKHKPIVKPVTKIKASAWVRVRRSLDKPKQK